jgi:FkbM family methyltransferase
MQDLSQNKCAKYVPFMNDIEIQSIGYVLRLFNKPIQAVEWGSGNSTVYFSANLPLGSKWISVEHDQEWALKSKAVITEVGNSDIELYHVPSDNWQGYDDGNYDTFSAYILFPTTLKKKFEFILVDGRARVECMQIGWMLLKNSGLMILHDAQRNSYKKGIPADCHYLRMTNPYIDIDGKISILFMSKTAFVINLLLELLKNNLPGHIQYETDSYVLSIANSKMSWEKLGQFPTVKLYAGDVPAFIEYEGLIGLSLHITDYRHIQHDLHSPFPLPDNSVDNFQVEDVFEHIAYDHLLSIINEIYRVLKPGAIFRLSLPDYGCDILRDRSVKDSSGNIIFDPGGGGSPENPGHLWFPRIDSVKNLLEQTEFAKHGEIEYLHYYNLDGAFVMKSIDYSKGHVRRTPDFDARVNKPYRPMSLIIDCKKEDHNVNQSLTDSSEKMSNDTLIHLQVSRNKKFFGSEYGGWTVCPELISKDSIIYSFGIGEDISFDLALIEEFGVEVHAFDPTPKSLAWIKKQELPAALKIHDFGIADYDGRANFYPPEHPAHVSHSIIEKPETRSRAIMVNVHQLTTIMKSLGNDKIDLLKMDIEGAEYSVIKHIISNKIRIKQLCIEFHHFFNNIDIVQTYEAVRLLNENGFSIFDVSSRGYEISFVNLR